MPKLALIEYFTTEEKVYIFVVRPGDDKPVVLESMVTEQALKECRDKLLGNEKKSIRGTLRMANHYKGPGADIDFFYDLYEFLIQPFLPYVEGYDTLYLVPHGWLHYFPLHALRDKDQIFLIERFKIVYSPSATVIKYCQVNNKVRRKEHVAHWDRSCLALGVGMEKDKPGSRDIFHNEAIYVAADLFGTKGSYRTGIEASKQYFLENCKDKDVLHTACHGYFNENQSLHSGLLLANGSRLPMTHENESGTIEVPDDMLLTAKEIFNLDIHSDLVVLSACVTGVNEKKPGDELIGLTRAFIYAGTPSVMVSLWSVNSKATLELMKSFYKYWTDREHPVSKVEALQKAQLEMLHSKDVFFTHPYFWAPFILVGDWL
jgi:CHAT domain-containing protein